MTSYAIQAGATRTNPKSGPDGVGVQKDIAYTLEARAEVQLVCGTPQPANDNLPLAALRAGNGQELRFLSVCSGIEAASVAWGPLGWRAVGFAEIDPAAALVLHRHYNASRPLFMPDPAEPGIKRKDHRARIAAIKATLKMPADGDVTNWGDFTRIDITKVGRVDILCGGTPCQAFSVAGARKSLADARGNLSLAFVELAHALAENNGLRNAVWENVPGVLNTKDNAFGCFLAGIVGADDVLPQPTDHNGKPESWPDAGMVAGPRARCAWRVLDAQYFGLAQRRRRVLLVADFGNGADPAAVLFERKGVHGNPAPRREAGEGIAPTISARTQGGGGLGADFDLDGGLVQATYVKEIAGALNSVGGHAVPGNSVQDATAGQLIAYGGNNTSGPIDVAAALNAKSTQRQDFESETFLVQPAICFTAKDYGAGGHKDSHQNGGVGPAIAYARETTGTLTLGHGGGAGHQHRQGDDSFLVAQTVALRGRAGGGTAELGGDVATALRASSGGGDKPHVLAEVHPTLAAGTGGPGSQDWQQHAAVYHASAVRRLTPKECERLQGFPDDYTRIPVRKYKEPKITELRPADMWERIDGEWWLMAADGPRYKQLGNSWAVPKFRWLGERIARHMPLAAANDNTAKKKAA